MLWESCLRNGLPDEALLLALARDDVTLLPDGTPIDPSKCSEIASALFVRLHRAVVEEARDCGFILSDA